MSSPDLPFQFIEGMGLTSSAMFDEERTVIMCKYEDDINVFSTDFGKEHNCYTPFTGAVKNNKLINFELSPNPTKDFIKIMLEEPLIEPITLRVLNTLGKTLLIQNMENQEQTLSLKNIPSGIYLLQVENGK